MSTGRKTRPKDRATRLLRGLQAALESLPSEQEKQQLVASLDQLRAFIDELRESVVSIPTGEGMGDAKAALEKLEHVYVKAASSPWLAATIGISPKRKASARPLSDQEKEEGGRLAQRLENLPTEQVEAKLIDEEQYPARQLRAVAQAFGIRSTKGYSRESLAHQIAMKIANARGYRALRGE
jgi:hypothetical protein